MRRCAKGGGKSIDLYEYRAQALICVVIHHPILTPILAARHEYETLSSLGMEWVGDLKRWDYRCTAVYMTGS